MFKDLLFTAVETCILTKSPRKMKNAPWLTPDVLKLIGRKELFTREPRYQILTIFGRVTGI